MATNRTFTMLKPDAVEKGHIGAILEKINASGFRIVAMKLTHMTKQDAEAFYAIHKERPFFGELVEYMTRGPIVAAILESLTNFLIYFAETHCYARPKMALDVIANSLQVFCHLFHRGTSNPLASAAQSWAT